MTRAIDPITLEILKNSMIWTCKEMAKIMERISYTPLFSEAWDFANIIMDAKTEHIAQFSWQAAQLGAMGMTVEWIVKEIGPECIEPGDLLFQNDSYRGGTHVPEVTLVRPIFYNGELLGFTGCLAHLVDIGGIVPGGFPPLADDIFQEGIRIPPVKIWQNDKPVEDVLKIFLNNVRVPRDIEGDLNAMIASVIAGEKRIIEYVDKYGLETIKSFFEAIKDYSERIMRSELKKIPDGNYEGEDYVDDDGLGTGPVRIKVTAIKRGGSIILDYTGTDKQVRGPINCPWSVTASATYNAMLHLTDPYIPINYGCFRPIKVIAPRGTVVNVESPGPINGGHTEASNHTIFAVIKALSKAIPHKVAAAGPDTYCNISGGGEDSRYGRYCVFWFGTNGGSGARATKDGSDATPGIIGNTRNFPVEITEVRYPWRIEEAALRVDSGGAGQYRGGMGTVRRYKFVGNAVTVNIFADRHEVPPYGLFGGESGIATEILLARKGKDPQPLTEYGFSSPTKCMNLKLENGDTIVVKSPGGGGYGNPLERDPMMVSSDVREGYVSLKAAAEKYAVIFQEKTFKVDETKTKHLRNEKRGEGRCMKN